MPDFSCQVFFFFSGIRQCWYFIVNFFSPFFILLRVVHFDKMWMTLSIPCSQESDKSFADVNCFIRIAYSHRVQFLKFILFNPTGGVGGVQAFHRPVGECFSHFITMEQLYYIGKAVVWRRDRGWASSIYFLRLSAFFIFNVV